LEALTMAIVRQRPAPGLIHHSDRGIQYAAEPYQLARSGIIPSMNCKGDCLDNAPMESFFHSLKTERSAGPPPLDPKLPLHVRVANSRRRWKMFTPSPRAPSSSTSAPAEDGNLGSAQRMHPKETRGEPDARSNGRPAGRVAAAVSADLDRDDR
jgi:transposase InsO family protein